MANADQQDRAATHTLRGREVTGRQRHSCPCCCCRPLHIRPPLHIGEVRLYVSEAILCKGLICQCDPRSTVNEAQCRQTVPVSQPGMVQLSSGAVCCSVPDSKLAKHEFLIYPNVPKLE